MLRAALRLSKVGAIPVTWSRELSSAPSSLPHCKPTATGNQQKARLRVMLEDLSVAGMAKNHKLARAIADAGWRLPRTLLESKATSQTCSACGAEHNRDVNATKNMLTTAQTSRPGASLC